jgi:hypothetical protein
MTGRTEVLLIGGRSGVGKSTVAFETSVQLAVLGTKHAVIEGDSLDLAHPHPPPGFAAKNLAALWRNYRELGYRRLIYTNTNSVISTDTLLPALGDNPRAVAVLLTATDATVHQRLAAREIGSALDAHLDRSRAAATRLSAAPPWVIRLSTDDRTTVSLARELIRLAGWASRAT